ncbi:alkaline phosphatase D family protein [Solwaraspora sp. WMMD792]|uniref:alkaline phosphatase D family protein n=1 Tax=Solwaraspora sp. WMMD792 TaxID=3016099 RepID=UPI002416E18B|nr:alkaline phosphatase D family protein [Solwaraspora sp. WMMD792]MDG4769686.1 alkaline phosphatase D family protein [Solwaraspora sp. WMMD792]
MTDGTTAGGPDPQHRPAAGPRLLIGPLLRRVVGRQATIWVETDAPATVRVATTGTAGGSARTFSAFGHHYALVVVDGLAPGSSHRYEVFLDDRRVWPEPDSPYPGSVIRTRRADDGAQPVRLIFGSCRETTQHSTARRLPPDALDAYARRLAGLDPAGGDWPDLLLLLGDQVYADETSPVIRRFLRRRRRHRGLPPGAPADQVVSFPEYTRLYLESWRDPEIRWLLSTVPSVMIFDDHEVIDDWNTSAAWRARMLGEPWWPERISSGLASYWVYQHLGNLAPDEVAADPVFRAVTAADDATDVLREFGARVDAEADVAHDPQRWSQVQYQWSFSLGIGRTRVIVLDNRCSRVLRPGARSMLPAGEWAWFTDRAHGRYDHLVVGASLPWLMPPGIHHLESWNERLAESPRRWVAAASEWLRQALDLEHWAAFRRSFDDLGQLFARVGAGPAAVDGTQPDRVGAGPGYPPPASISMLSGDVHHSYVARAVLPGRVRTPVHQLTCSPIHNQVPALMRPLMRLGWWRGPTAALRALARSAGLPRPSVRWRKLDGPYFGNAVSTLLHDGATAEVTLEGTTTDGALREVARRRLTDSAAAQPTPQPPQQAAGLAQ